jgi:conjugative relaxase-like TrwC/TraI family protein
MLTISRPLSAAQVVTYHAEEFSNARENYYTRGDTIPSQWHGQLATRWGLSGEVTEAHVAHLAQGRHPITGEQLVQHQTPRSYVNARGKTVTPMAHRAAWDGTFSAPKSVSITALVDEGDARVRAAHQASVRVALDAMEPYVQARLGRNQPAETTGQWVAATYEHESARPVDGYAAPQLHTHVVTFNLTERANGSTRALQTRELFKTQSYATAVYRAELATRLTALGYEIECGASGQPEIRGYTPEYLEASSPRRQQIEAHLQRTGQRGAGAAQIAAHRTRAAKQDIAHEETQRRHQALAEAHGHQREAVSQAARDRVARLDRHVPRTTAREAVTFAKAHNFEREAVVHERALRRDAYRRGMAEVTVGAVSAEFERRVAAGEFVARAQPPGTPGRAFTTRELIALETQSIEMMRAGRETQPALVHDRTRHDIARTHAHLSDAQRAAVAHIFASRDQVLALEGVAGGGKTTALAAVREGAEREGYRVEGFAPTSRAAQKLAEAGIDTTTLQHYLLRRPERAEGPDAARRLYVLDESSLASTRQIHAFLQRLSPTDRVLLVGDVRQHQAVEAGRPYQQLQEAGLDIARLDDIIRQQDPALKVVVERLAHGEVRDAIHDLDQQGRVHEIPKRDARLTAIAHAYAADPDGTLVVSPDNRSRVEINQRIHARLQTIGRVDAAEHQVRVLVPRQEITGADRQWAQQYEPGDVLRYSTGSKVLDIPAGAYARVHAVDAPGNRLTVHTTGGEVVTYDPRRLQGVAVYRETDRTFAKGDRLQVTAPDRERHIANRELGTLEHIDASGELRLRLDSGRRVTFSLDDHPHLDYGYAVTSHSSQGQTADRVIVHVDTAAAGKQLVNRRLAYVAVSRGRYDAQIYTNDKAQLGKALSRETSHRSAMELGQVQEASTQKLEPSATRRQDVQLTITR